MVEKSSSSSTGPTVLERTLDKNTAVADDVQRASQDLSIVNTVLEQELPEDVQVGEVAQAIAHTGEIERKLAESAEKLAEVNAALAKEIEKRIEVTQQRDQSRAAVRELQRRTDDSGAADASSAG